MKISEVNIEFTKPVNGLIGFASIVINDELYLGSIGIFTTLSGGHRITYPTRKVGPTSINISHPISKKAGEEIKSAILDRLDEILNK
jgi:stage V sporulation protein G